MMREEFRYQPRKVCFPIGSLSCIPEDAIKAEKFDAKWGFYKKGDRQMRFIDIADASNLGYFVPQIEPNIVLTNLHQIYGKIGAVLLMLGIIFGCMAEYFYQSLSYFWAYFLSLSALDQTITLFIGIICLFCVFWASYKVVYHYKVIVH